MTVMNAWLLPTFQREIHDGLVWLEHKNTDPLLPPSTRFVDDGSNLRIIFSQKQIVQIIKYETLQPPIQAWVADSDARIKATFTASAVERFRSEHRKNLKGTIKFLISLLDIEIVATHLGSRAKNFTILIKDFITLRRGGNKGFIPRPVESIHEFQELLAKLQTFRESIPSINQRKLPEKSLIESSPFHMQGEPHGSVIHGHNQSQQGFATQVPHFRASDSNSRTNDECDLQAGRCGINESVHENTRSSVHPSGVIHRSDSTVRARLNLLFGSANDGVNPLGKCEDKLISQIPGDQQRLAAPSTKTSHSINPEQLLSLLSKNQKSKPKAHLTPLSLPAPMKADTINTETSVQVEQPPNDPTIAAEKKNEIKTNFDTRLSDDESVNTFQPPRAKNGASCLDDMSVEDYKAPRLLSHHKSNLTLNKVPLRVSSRDVKVPKNQKALLDRPDSWVPSEPGQRAPKANVPITTLQSISDRVESILNRSRTRENSRNSTKSSQSLSIDSKADEDSELEIPISSGDWPPSPLREIRQQLPPDSSFESSIPLQMPEDKTTRSRSSVSKKRKLSDASSLASAASSFGEQAQTISNRPISNHSPQKISFRSPLSSKTSATSSPLFMSDNSNQAMPPVNNHDSTTSLPEIQSQTPSETDSSFRNNGHISPLRFSKADGPNLTWFTCNQCHKQFDMPGELFQHKGNSLCEPRIGKVKPVSTNAASPQASSKDQFDEKSASISPEPYQLQAEMMVDSRKGLALPDQVGQSFSDSPSLQDVRFTGSQSQEPTLQVEQTPYASGRGSGPASLNRCLESSVLPDEATSEGNIPYRKDIESDSRILPICDSDYMSPECTKQKGGLKFGIYSDKAKLYDSPVKSIVSTKYKSRDTVGLQYHRNHSTSPKMPKGTKKPHNQKNAELRTIAVRYETIVPSTELEANSKNLKRKEFEVLPLSPEVHKRCKDIKFSSSRNSSQDPEDTPSSSTQSRQIQREISKKRKNSFPPTTPGSSGFSSPKNNHSTAEVHSSAKFRLILPSSDEETVRSVVPETLKARRIFIPETSEVDDNIEWLRGQRVSSSTSKETSQECTAASLTIQQDRSKRRTDISKQLESSTEAKNSTITTLFERFRETYPIYNGSLNQFTAICKRVYLLYQSDRMEHKSLWDDFIIRHRIDYSSYLARCADLAEDPVPYEKFYGTEIEKPLYLDGIITPKALNEALLRVPQSGHSDKKPGLEESNLPKPNPSQGITMENLKKVTAISIGPEAEPSAQDVIDLTLDHEVYSSKRCHGSAHLPDDKTFRSTTSSSQKINEVRESQASIHECQLEHALDETLNAEQPTEPEISSVKPVSILPRPVISQPADFQPADSSPLNSYATSLTNRTRAKPSHGVAKPTESWLSTSRISDLSTRWWQDEKSPFKSFFKAYTSLRSGRGNSWARTRSAKPGDGPSEQGKTRIESLKRLNVLDWQLTKQD